MPIERATHFLGGRYKTCDLEALQTVVPFICAAHSSAKQGHHKWSALKPAAKKTSLNFNNIVAAAMQAHVRSATSTAAGHRHASRSVPARFAPAPIAQRQARRAVVRAQLDEPGTPSPSAPAVVDAATEQPKAAALATQPVDDVPEETFYEGSGSSAEVRL